MARYTIDGIEMIGVTSVLDQIDKSNMLIPWGVNLCGKYIEMNYREGMTITEMEALIEIAKREFRTVSGEAMDIGSQIHDLIEKYIKSGMDAVGEMRDEVQNGFLAFLEWEAENITRWIESEQPVFDMDLCYAGTLDAIAELKGGSVVVIDFKSSKGFYDGYAEQISAYKFARQKLSGTHTILFNSDFGNYEKQITYKPINIDGCGILRLDKLTGIPEWKDYTKEHDRKYKSFCYLLDFYYANKKRRLKNNHRVK